MCRLRRRRLPGPAPAGGFRFAALRPASLLRAPPGRFRGAAFGGGDCRDPPRRWFWICRAATARRPSAGGVSRRRPPGEAITGIAARGRQEIRARSAARHGFLFGRTKRNEKSAQGGLHRPLRYPLENLAITRRLPPLPTGTPAEGSIQVAGAPNDRSRIARHNPQRKTTPVSGVRALRARARRSRAVFRLRVGAARHAKAAVPPHKHPRYGSGGSPAEALRLRRGGGRDAVGLLADP